MSAGVFATTSRRYAAATWMLTRCQFGFMTCNCNTIVQISSARSVERAHMERLAVVTVADQAWHIVLGAAAEADWLSDASGAATYAATDAGELRPVADNSPDAVLRWEPELGWSVVLPPSDARQTLIDLYLPIC